MTARERTEWHRIQLWGRLGETPPPSRRARTSAHICIECELRSRYESNGAKVRTYDIVANSGQNPRANQRSQTEPTEDAAYAASINPSLTNPGLYFP